MIKIFYKRFFLVLFLLVSIHRVQAQAEIAKELIALANEMFTFGDYNDALEIYKQAIEFDPENIEAHFMAGKCYLKTTAYKANSVDHFLFVMEKNKEYNNMLQYYIAEGLRFDYSFDEAIKYYKEFEEEVNVNYRWFADKDTDLLKLKAAKKIKECENAKLLTKEKKRISITNLGDAVNCEHMDYAPTLNANEDMLIFTSRRDGTTGGLKDNDNMYFEDIWVSYLKDGDWTYPENMGSVVNSNNHDSNLGLSPDGKTLFIYKIDNHGDIYASRKKGDKWSKPKPFEKFINTAEGKESSICLSTDGNYLFYSSTKSGGMGKSDLYMSKLDEKGKWTEPVNLGNVINTEFEEESPSFHAESKALYFSSVGHNSMGNFDIFRSFYDEASNTWTEPENLGYPLNTTDSDIFLTISSDGKKGYYSSFKKDSRGGNDIYIVDNIDEIMDAEEAPEEPIDSTPEEPIDTIVIEPTDTPLAVIDEPIEDPIEEPIEDTTTTVAEVEPDPKQIKLIVTVTAPGSTTPLPANFKIIEKESNHIIDELFLESGTYTTTFSNFVDKVYLIEANAEGYLYQTDNITINIGEDSPTEVTVKLPLREKVMNRAYVFRNIYFDFDRSSLRPESSIEIDNILAELNNNPNYKIVIEGHTDNIGSHDYNMQLSQNRANSVKKSLIKKGVDSSRITAIGYGETKPMGSNEDFADLNRRTVFILKD